MIAITGPQIPDNLNDYFLRVYWPRKIGCQPRTKKLYLLTIVVFDRWLRRPSVAAELGRPPDMPAQVGDLNDATLCAFLQSRVEEVSGFSAAKDRSNLLGIANYAAKKRHLPEFVDVPPVPITWPTPHAMRPDDFGKLLDAAASLTGEIGGVPAAHWWRAILLVFLITGERTEATLALRWEWLRDDGWLTVPAAARKGRRKSMSYWLPPSVVADVQRLRGNKSEMIFDRSWCVGTFYHRYEALLRIAGLPTGRRWKPQCLRRTFASYVKLLGGNATDALAHDSPSTTKKHYLDPTLAVGSDHAKSILQAFGLV